MLEVVQRDVVVEALEYKIVNCIFGSVSSVTLEFACGLH